MAKIIGAEGRGDYTEHLSCPVPAGTEANDVIIATQFSDTGSRDQMQPPSADWVALDAWDDVSGPDGSGSHLRLWGLVADGTETEFTFSQGGGTTSATLTLVTLRQAGLTGTISDGSFETADSPYTTPSLSGAAAGSVLLCGASIGWGGASWKSSDIPILAGGTDGVDETSATGGQLLDSDGDTGTRTFTPDRSGTYNAFVWSIALPATAQLSDTFDRADSTTTLGTADTGQTWNPQDGSTWGVDTNQAYAVSTSSETALIDAGANDVDVEVDITYSSGSLPSLVFRAESESNRLVFAVDETQVLFWKKSNGAASPINESAASFTRVNGQPYRARVTAQGATLTAYIDGTQITSYTLTGDDLTQFTGDTYTNVGLRASDGTRFDNLSANPSAPAAAPTVNAGPRVDSWPVNSEFARVAYEDANGADITSRSWEVTYPSTETGQVGTTKTLSWTPTTLGVHTLQYTATNSVGDGSDSFAITVVSDEPPGSIYTLDDWKLTLPTGQTQGDPTDITQPDLDTYVDEHFFLDGDQQMTMVAPVDGIHTSGSGATRCELREMQDGTEAAWTPRDEGRHALTVTGYFDPVGISGGSNPRQEMIIGQIHGELGSPPVYLAAEYHVATPRVRVFKYDGTGSPGVGNMLEGLTRTTEITYRIEYVPGADPINGTGQVNIYGANGGASNLPASPNFTFTLADFFDQTTGWYFKAGSYNKTTVDSGSTGQSTATITYLDLVQPAAAVDGAIHTSVPAPAAALTADVADTGALAAELPAPAAALTGTTSYRAQLDSALPLPTAALTGKAGASGALDTTLPLPVADLTATVEYTATLDASLPLPTAQLSSTASTRGPLDTTLPLPTAQLTSTLRSSGALDTALPAPAAALTGTVTAGGGTLHSSLPLPVSALTSSTDIRGHLDTALPVPAGALAATATTTGELGGTLPTPTASLAATTTDTGTLNTTLPQPTAALTGTVRGDGATLAGQVPPPTARLAANVTTAGQLGGTLPLPDAHLEGGPTQTGQLHTGLPLPVAALTATVGTTGDLEASLPTPVATLDGSHTSVGALSAFLPTPGAALHGNILPAGDILDAPLPVPTAALTGNTRTTGVLHASLPLLTAALIGTPPRPYTPPLRAGEPRWGFDRLHAGEPVGTRD